MTIFLSFCVLFVITAAGAVPCGGPIKSPRAIVQIIFFFCSFEISMNIQIFVRLGPPSKQCFNFSTPFRNVSLI